MELAGYYENNNQRAAELLKLIRLEDRRTHYPLNLVEVNNSELPSLEPW